MTIEQLHRLTGRTRRTVTKLLEGLEPLSKKGRAKVYASRAALEHIYLRGGRLNLADEQARLAAERADAQALRNQLERGELVRGAEVEQTWVWLASTIKARLLQVPSMAAPAAHAARSVAESEEAIRGEVIEALSALADTRVR